MRTCSTVFSAWSLALLFVLSACSSGGGGKVGSGGTAGTGGAGGAAGDRENTGGPSFVINSPVDGSVIAGTVWLSAQPASRRPIQKVTFTAGDDPVEVDDDPSDGFRVFLTARNFPAGELELRAVAEGTDGLLSAQSITVTNVPNPPSTATIGDDGAALGTEDGSVVIIPPGVAGGNTLSVKALSQSEFESRTGVDLVAMGITYLGGQAVTGSRALDGPVTNLGAGFAEATSEDQAIRQFTVYSDLDGDGAPEIIVTNDASITPDGDILSNPLPVAVIGENASTTTTKSTRRKVLNGLVQVRQGEALTVDVYGFNPFSVIEPIATWSTSVAINTTSAALRSNLEAAGQLFTAVCPPNQPPGFGTVTFSQETLSGTRSVRAEIEVLEAAAPGGSAGENTEEFLDQVGDALENLPVPEASEDVAESTVEELQNIKDDMVEQERQAQERVGDTRPDPTLEQEGALEDADLIVDYPGDPPAFDPNATCITQEQSDKLWDIYDAQWESARRLAAAGETETANAIKAATLNLGNYLLDVVEGGLLCEDQDDDEDNDTHRDPLPKPDIPPAPDDDSPNPGDQISSVPALCGQPPPGGDGGGSPLLKDGSEEEGIGPKRLGAAQSLLGRVVVRVDHEGSDNPIRSISDASGYIYVPFFEAGKRFVATALDRVTRQTRTYEGVAPAYRDSTYLFFNFRTEDAVDLCTPPQGYNKTWRGFVSNEWFEPLNWDPEGVPVSTDNVYICPDAAGQPSQTRDTIVVNDLLIPPGASVVNSSPLVRVSVLGDLDATGGISGTGPVLLLGGTIKGTVHTLQVWEPSSLAGDTTITQGIDVTEPSLAEGADADSTLTLAGHTLTAETFRCCLNGAQSLIMDDPNDRLVISGAATFAGMTGLADGVIELRGNGAFCGNGGSSVPFESVGTKVIFSGDSPQTLAGTNGCSMSYAQFADIELLSPSEMSTFVPLRLSGDLIVREGATMNFTPGSSLEWTTVGGDVDLSGSMTVNTNDFVTVLVSGTLKLNATGTLENDGSLSVAACDPRDGTIIGTDPCPPPP
jgi:hypothetical protein